MRKIFITTAVLATTAGFSTYVWQQEHRPPILEIFVFGLKNSQAIFIRTPDDKRILINGGSNSEIISRVSNILPFYSRRIDTVISTDTQGKNATGLIDVLERYSVDKIVVPAVTLESLKLSSSTDQIYSEFLKVVHKKKIPISEIIQGESISFGEKVQAKVLFPAPADGFGYSKASSPEVSLLVTYNSTSFIFVGSTSKKIQKYLIPQLDKPADALIISQSFTPANISKELFEVIQPKFIIHSQKISKPSNGSQDKLFNSQEGGMVKIVSDGESITVGRLY